MTQYDDVPGHPLAGVPGELLQDVYDTLAQGVPEVDCGHGTVDEDDLRVLTETLVAGLLDAGYLTWPPSPPPDRESLILGLNLAINEYLADTEARRRGSVVEAVVDQVVLPLLRRSNNEHGTTDSADEGGRVRRPDAGA